MCHTTMLEPINMHGQLIRYELHHMLAVLTFSAHPRIPSLQMLTQFILANLET